VARSFVRRQQALPVHDPLPEDEDAGAAVLAVDGAGPLDRVLRDLDLERMRRAIALLPPPYREALILVELQECSYAEAAAQCGCALGTIRSRLSRARALLAGTLVERDAPPVALRR
jgi:RNA polymerase sigma-70 factor (ECF subfamily)